MKVLDIYSNDLGDGKGGFIDWLDLPDQPRLLLNLDIAIVDEETGDIHGFSAFIVCGYDVREYIISFCKNSIPLGTYFFQSFVSKIVANRLEGEIESCRSPNWQSSLEKLRKKFLWEHEDI